MTSIRQAAATLAAAGVASPLIDAQILASHVLQCSRMDVVLRSSEDLPAEFDQLVARRARREPLQHILGNAPVGHLDLQVGPGVFVPRPETELLGQWAVHQLANVETPNVVDLCAGSGTLALYVASLVPTAKVTAVELDSEAREWLLKNAAGTAVRVEAGDATDPELLPQLTGRVNLVVSNPPYVPEGTPVEPEVAADPHHAVFGGDSGMDVIDNMVPVIARLLCDGGRVGIEHDDATAALVCRALAEHGFIDIQSHQDLAGRDRYVTATKPGE